MSQHDRIRDLLIGKIISIEGVIGVGKTTLGKSLERYIKRSYGIDVVFYTEPFNQKMLEQFLTNQKKYAYPFQLYMLTRRQLNYARAQDVKNTNTCAIIDRSLAGDYVFAKLQQMRGNITDEDFAIYQSVYDEFGPYKPHHVLYLNVPPETAMERIRNRDREGEKAYTDEYLTDLSKVYTNVLSAYHPGDINLHHIDWRKNATVSADGFLDDDTCEYILGQMVEDTEDLEK